MSDHDSHADTDRELAQALAQDRVVPRPEFLRTLRGHLSEADPGYGPRPEHLTTTMLGYGVGGLILLAVGVLQAGGWL